MLSQTLTYFPGSKQVYEGHHLEKPSIGAIALRDSKDEMTVTDPHLLKASAQLKAGNDTGIAGSDVIDRLRYIKLFSEVGGKSHQFFHLSEAYEKRDLNSLELDEDIEGIDSGVEFPTGKLEENEEAVYNVGQIHLSCSKLKKTVTSPLEAQLRSMHDPMMLKLQQIDFAFALKKNQLAKAAIEDGIIHNVTGGSTLKSISDMNAIGANATHSTNDPIEQISAEFTAFIKANSVPINCVIMSSNSWLRLSRNTYVQNSGAFGLRPKSAPEGISGESLPGISNCQAVIDPSISDSKMYFINKQTALRHCRGPILQKSWEDYRRDNFCTSRLEFLNFFSVDALLKGEERKRIGNRVFSFVMDVDAHT